MIDTALEFLLRYYPIIGAGVMVLVLIYDREQLDIKLDGMSKFVGLMVLVMFARLVILEGDPPPDMYGFSLSRFKLVFLEDAFFVMIPYYINKKIDSPMLRGAVWIFFSGLFATGHMYQGFWGMFITSLYPFFISYKYVKKTTFATVMACHFIYDCFALITVKIHTVLEILAGINL